MPSIRPNIENYAEGRAAGGNKTKHCGDIVATVLDGWPVENVRALAENFDVETSKYDHLNPGHQRMVLGGVFRRLVREQDKAHASGEADIGGDDWFKAVAEGFQPDPAEVEAAAKPKRKRSKKAAEAAEAAA